MMMNCMIEIVKDDLNCANVI